MRTLRTLALALALPAAFLAGCGDDFAPYSELDRLRILAVQAEPASPLPGQAVELSALTFAPGGEAMSYAWSWCPAGARAGAGYACPFDATAAASALTPYLDPGTPALPSLTLGNAAGATFSHPFSAAGLVSLCASGLVSPAYSGSFDCDGGFPVTIVLDVATVTSSLRAGFVLRLPTDPASELNHNPVLAGITLAGQALPESPVALRATPEQTLDLGVELPMASAELRTIPPAEGGPGQRLERLTVSWFADHGRIESARTSFIDGETTLGEAARNQWTAPATAAWPASGIVQLAAVLRDDRGGTAWLVRQVVLEQAP